MNEFHSTGHTAEKPVNEQLLLFVLAAIQFTTIVDFLIVMPLGPQYMRVFNISPAQFGLIVSTYAIAAGISGLCAGLFLDRFDRKRALLTIYGGFALGTLFCALAPGYHALVLARAMAGAFGGVSGALVMAIIGDVIPEKRRGAAMGLVMSAFSVASICGVPIGLLLASHLTWHVPFFALTGVSVIILLAAARVLPLLRGHMAHAHNSNPVRQIMNVLGHKDHQISFLFMISLTFAGFVIFPYLSTYMVANAGLTEKQLPLIYLIGGACTIVSLNLIGRWADRIGKHRVFTYVSLACVIPVLALTNLPRVPLLLALTISSVFMVVMSGRMVPAMALMTGSIEPRFRGGFMSVNSAIQQFSSGIAAYVSGIIMGQGPGGEMTRFWVIGIISISCLLICIPLSRYLKVKPDSTVQVVPLIVES